MGIRPHIHSWGGPGHLGQGRDAQSDLWEQWPARRQPGVPLAGTEWPFVRSWAFACLPGLSRAADPGSSSSRGSVLSLAQPVSSHLPQGHSPPPHAGGQPPPLPVSLGNGGLRPVSLCCKVLETRDLIFFLSFATDFFFPAPPPTPDPDRFLLACFSDL